MQLETNCCAYCGEPIGDSAELWLQFPELPGSPEVRWHWSEDGGCAHHDQVCAELREANDFDVVPLLVEVEQRGIERLADSPTPAFALN